MRAGSCRRNRPGSSQSSPTAWSITCSIERVRRFGSARNREPPQRAPAVANEAGPVVERQWPTAQAGIARDRITPVDAAQDWVFELGFGEFLCRAEELLGAYALTQLVTADARRPANVPDPCGVVAGCRQHAAAVRAECCGADGGGVSTEDGNLLAARRIPDARRPVKRRRHHEIGRASCRE